MTALGCSRTVRPRAGRAAPRRAGAALPRPEGREVGLLNRAGLVVVSPRFDEASRFSEGLAPVRLDKVLGYADETGRVVLVPGHGPAGGTLHRKFSGGRAVVRSGARYGYIDPKGRLAVPARWLTAEDFSEGRALVCDEGGCGFVDPEGRYAHVPDAMGGTSYRNGIASIVLAMGMTHRRTAFLDSTGNLIPGEYEGNGNYAEGLAPVRFRGKWGYVDGGGKPVIRNDYQEAADFSEGLAAVTLDSGRCGYVDRTGKLAVPARFASCGPFSGGPRAGGPLGTVERRRARRLRGPGRHRGDPRRCIATALPLRVRFRGRPRAGRRRSSRPRRRGPGEDRLRGPLGALRLAPPALNRDERPSMMRRTLLLLALCAGPVLADDEKPEVVPVPAPSGRGPRRLPRGPNPLARRPGRDGRGERDRPAGEHGALRSPVRRSSTSTSSRRGRRRPTPSGSGQSARASRARRRPSTPPCRAARSAGAGTRSSTSSSRWTASPAPSSRNGSRPSAPRRRSAGTSTGRSSRRWARR